MTLKKGFRSLLASLLMVAFSGIPGYACTIVAVGKNATIDGTAMITHNDDSTTANYQLFIIPAADHPEGAVRDMVMDAHGYPGDEKIVGKIPQVKHTYRYFHSRYSFMNEMGVAIGESTNSIVESDERSKRVKKVMATDAAGLFDAWMIQDVMLERAATAREAVEIMGKLIDEHGFYDASETMNLTDGNEVWIIEFYGNKMWAAWRLPDDGFFVGANRARLRNLDLTDKKNVMYAPGMVDYAVANGFIEKKDINQKDFSPADVFAPNTRPYSMLREWRAMDMVAPSLKLDPKAKVLPLYVKPEKKLSVQDIFDIKGDWYEGTEFDMSKGPAAGPWGNPLRYANKSKEDPKADWPRTINMHRTCYLHIAQVSSDQTMPKELRGVSWYGYGAPDTAYLTPLWAVMKELPTLYTTGSRFEDFDRESGWWISTYVQQSAEMRYQDARKIIHEKRAPKMNDLYRTTPLIQKQAAELFKAGNRDAAVDMIQNFAYSNAVDWFYQWRALGDHLYGKYSLGTNNFKTVAFPDWWNKLVGFEEQK